VKAFITLAFLFVVAALAIAQVESRHRIYTPEHLLKEQPTNEISVSFRVAKAYGISGAVPVGEEPSFGLQPSRTRNDPRFSILIAGELVKEMKKEGVNPMKPSAFFENRVVEVTGMIVKVSGARSLPVATPSYQLVARDSAKFRVIE
jgi:hypothetical protein